jgi:hypothetical protein
VNATTKYQVTPVGWVESALVDLDTAPKQGDEGAPHAWLVFESDLGEGIRDLTVGTEVIVRPRSAGRNAHCGRQTRAGTERSALTARPPR